MSHLLEITIKLQESSIYLRLVLAAYLITMGLVLYTSLYFLVKIILITVLVLLLRKNMKNRIAISGVKEIQFIKNKWLLTAIDDKKQQYTEAQLLIHNTLFQLIQFREEKYKKIIVLFSDQVQDQQLRSLNFQIAKM